MINYIRRFGLYEYVFFIMGLLVLGKLTYSYLTDTLEYSLLSLIAFLVGVLLLAAPRALVKIIKEKTPNMFKK